MIPCLLIGNTGGPFLVKSKESRLESPVENLIRLCLSVGQQQTHTSLLQMSRAVSMHLVVQTDIDQLAARVRHHIICLQRKEI